MGSIYKTNLLTLLIKPFKGILSLIIVLCFWWAQYAHGQAQPCSKPRVAVILAEIFDQVFTHLDTQYSSQSKEQ